MTENPYAVTPDSRIEAVVDTLISQKYGSAVVIEDDSVVGIFTRSDALRALLGLLNGRSSQEPETDVVEDSPVPP
jgi:CBS domain-containing protein